MIDYKGLENALKALNDLQEQHPELMRGATVLIDNINANVVPDLGELYLMAQNDDNVPRRMAGVLKECSRFLEVFTIDRIRGFAPSLLMCILKLQNTVATLMEFEPAEAPTESKSQQLLGGLNTSEAKQIFQRAIAARIIEETGKGYKWYGRKQLLAYFAERMSNKFKLSDKLDKEGNTTVSWKPFEDLFGVENLRSAKNDWMKVNTKFTPTGYEQIDDILGV